ncbi:hypothetical protein IA57_03365 [Mangrovimonas yunxiaonensis]|uniref:Outer membrane protein n=1 Tax=Mangrovimonas yunxiaonensis TaxID=1197477 RepID=A0A084TMI5_9FLAO|nr:hypothetical protein [Mangrovimonas yunxiaonensis]KFB01921.1 hypothetical protein IA57_03365 [Mangrovimonas yunxiaonensis]GGH44737.1 hypothetical protein GCM10011364_17720 [Mangrovimonas yunxiaonensis]
MFKFCAFSLFFVLCFFKAQSQTPKPQTDTVKVVNDSIKRVAFIKSLANGYLPTKYVDFDLKYLFKYNQYEGFRTGLGGETNQTFSQKYKLAAYAAYGFRDQRLKYGFSGGIRLIPNTNTWINLSYTDDLLESGSSNFLTDKRFFQVFQPRLLNINLFHRHVTKALSFSHQVSPKLLSEIQFAFSDIDPTYNYNYFYKNRLYHNFDLATTTLSFQWSPFSIYESINDVIKETKNGYPKFTLQYMQSYRNAFGSDFDFSKIDFRTLHQITHKNTSKSEFLLRSGLALGHVPLTHLYHAYPNNINKETLLQRFSVGGFYSFETMFFNEFFSDRYATLQLKHYFKAFNIANRFKPQLVVSTRFAIGNMNHIARHHNITFNTLNKGYTESTIEINKLLFGFGLSGSYRYGAYHLPNLEDNIAIKFTFNITL